MFKMFQKPSQDDVREFLFYNAYVRAQGVVYSEIMKERGVDIFNFYEYNKGLAAITRAYKKVIATGLMPTKGQLHNLIEDAKVGGSELNAAMIRHGVQDSVAVMEVGKRIEERIIDEFNEMLQRLNDAGI